MYTVIVTDPGSIKPDCYTHAEPFQVTSMDITGPHLITPRKNRYLFIFIDHFSKYVEAFQIPDVSTETCARVCATRIIVRHSSGSTLITDQERSLISTFFQEICKTLKVIKVEASVYHAMSGGMMERFPRVLLYILGCRVAILLNGS